MPMVPVVLSKVSRVRDEGAALRAQGEKRFVLTPEVARGVQLVLVDVRGHTMVFSLWTRADDVAFLASDPAVPALTAALAVDEAELRALADWGHRLDLSRLTRSLSAPDLHYALLHYESRRQIQRCVRRMVLQDQPSAAAA